MNTWVLVDKKNLAQAGIEPALRELTARYWEPEFKKLAWKDTNRLPLRVNFLDNQELEELAENDERFREEPEFDWRDDSNPATEYLGFYFRNYDGREAIFIFVERIKRAANRFARNDDRFQNLLLMKVVMHEFGHSLTIDDVTSRRHDCFYETRSGKVVEESLVNAFALMHFENIDLAIVSRFVERQPPPYRAALSWSVVIPQTICKNIVSWREFTAQFGVAYVLARYLYNLEPLEAIEKDLITPLLCGRFGAVDFLVAFGSGSTPLCVISNYLQTSDEDETGDKRWRTVEGLPNMRFRDYFLAREDGMNWLTRSYGEFSPSCRSNLMSNGNYFGAISRVIIFVTDWALFVFFDDDRAVVWKIDSSNCESALKSQGVAASLRDPDDGCGVTVSERHQIDGP